MNVSECVLAVTPANHVDAVGSRNSRTATASKSARVRAVATLINPRRMFSSVAVDYIVIIERKLKLASGTSLRRIRMATVDDVKTALEGVHDPELDLDIFNLGLVYDVAVDGAKVDVEMTFTSPMCPVGPAIVKDATAAIDALEGVEETNIEIVWDPPWTMDMISEDLKFMLGRG